MSLPQLMAELLRRDVRVSVDGGEHLRVNAPDGALDDGLLQLLEDHKPQLIRVLLGWELHPHTARRQDPDHLIPTPEQHRVKLAERFAGDPRRPRILAMFDRRLDSLDAQYGEVWPPLTPADYAHQAHDEMLRIFGTPTRNGQLHPNDQEVQP